MPRTCSLQCITALAAAAPQTIQSSSSSVVTSRNVTASITRHVLNRSVQADSVDMGWPTCRTVSVADAAVEVGESLLVSSSQMHNCKLAPSLSVSVSVPSVMTASVQSNPVCSASMTDAATVRQSRLNEQLPASALDFQNTAYCQQTEHSAAVQQLPNHDTDSNHISRCSPVIVIAPEGSTSPGYQLSCDEHSSCEKNAEATTPLNSSAQLEASPCAREMV